MASVVVLMRHGKAIAAKGDMEDLARPLTSFGKRALVASMPDALLPLAYMPEFIKGDVQVWSSSAFRAMETAEIAASILGVAEIDEHMSLLSQDFDEFMTEAYNSEADVVVAVGHEPFVGQAAQRLCGTSLPFKTGAAAIFDTSEYNGEPVDGVLRHFVQGPRTERWKILVKIEEVLATSISNVETNMQLFLDNPQDVEALHDFRISIRTLRSNLGFVRPYAGKKQVKAIQSDLRDLVALTSYLRELDVFHQVVQDSPYCNDEVLAAVEKLRKKECRKLIDQISGKKARKRIRKLLAQAQNLKWKDRIEALGLSHDEILERFESIAVAFEASYLQTDYADVDATHDLRKLAKRVRYASRDFGPIIGEEAIEMAKAMKGIQEELGILCDARVNCEIIDALPRKKFSDDADTAVAAIKQEQIDIIMGILNAEKDDEGYDGQMLDEEVVEVFSPEVVSEDGSQESDLDILADNIEALEVEEIESYADEDDPVVELIQDEVEIADFVGDEAPGQE